MIEARSGETLLFDPFSAAVTACVESGANDLPSLLGMLAEDLPAGIDDACIAGVREVLDRLVRLGWIEPLCGCPP